MSDVDDQRDGPLHFAEFMAAEQALLMRFATALTGDVRLSEDLVADVLGRAYERWSRIGRFEHPGAYVRRMVINEFLSFKRRQRRHVVLLDKHAPPAADHASHHAEREDLKARLASLPPKQRAAIVLRYYEGMPTEEIASVLGCAHATVRSLIHRALTTLRVDQTPSGIASAHIEQKVAR